MRTSYEEGAGTGVVAPSAPPAQALLERSPLPAAASRPGSVQDGPKPAHRQLPIETHIGYLKQHTFRVSCSCGWMGMWQREPKRAFSAQARHAGRYM